MGWNAFKKLLINAVKSFFLWKEFYKCTEIMQLIQASHSVNGWFGVFKSQQVKQ